MSSSDRDRFLIAVAKLLGQNPTQPHPLSPTLLCEEWLLDEAVAEIIPTDGGFHLDHERFNRLMLHCGRRLATPHFYKCFFGNVRTLDEFEQAVDRYRIKAMWLFGNFAFGYKRIATTDRATFDSLIRKTEPVSLDSYTSRTPFETIEEIAVNDLSLLGYISSGELRDLDVAKKLVDSLRSEPGAAERILANLGSMMQEKVSAVLKKCSIAFPADGKNTPSDSELNDIAAKISAVYDPLKARQEAAVAVGKRNTHRYLTMPHLDVYVATSMREDQDYIAQHDFVKTVFGDPQVAELKLRYFDPTLSFVDDRISKGLIEMLMLRRATATIYNAGAEDTLGKDSELAATLAQGKAVIVYVPSDRKIVTLRDGREVDLDKRAETFRVGHPLGLQINMRTGVAHGILVVRTPKQCAEVLRKLMLRTLTFTIVHREGNYLLEETETKSIVRVVSDDPFLTHAFWTYFRHHTPEEN